MFEKIALAVAACMAMPHLVRSLWNSRPKRGTCYYCGAECEDRYCDGEDCYTDSRW